MFFSAVLAPAQDTADDLCFWFQGTDLLVIVDDENLRIPCRSELEALSLAPQRPHYLGSLSGRGCFAAAVADGKDIPPSWAWLGLRATFGRLDDLLFGLAGRAIQVVQWDLTHQFCGRCGTRTELGTSERSRICPGCSLVSYPRLAPAVMALVRRQRSLLLARSPHFPEGMFSALAGFVEPGESLEETLQREVREEVGVGITNLRYFGSQSWPFPHSLMIAFVADYLDGDIVPQPGEIEAADWFSIDRLPRLPHRISIARLLIDASVAEIAAMPV
ncbi:MAG: NAD(+) diphosphatase [Proteobacteria bacterium]|nr:NAD(+) diphosphatase [Pseudomonadota bacterium]